MDTFKGLKDNNFFIIGIFWLKLNCIYLTIAYGVMLESMSRWMNVLCLPV